MRNRQKLGARLGLRRLEGDSLGIVVAANHRAAIEILPRLAALQAAGVFTLQEKHSLKSLSAGVLRRTVGTDLDAGAILGQDRYGELGSPIG